MDLPAVGGNDPPWVTVLSIGHLIGYVRARLGERVDLLTESRASDLIWSAGTRVVPFTFVPVSARVPACQQSARRWAG